MYANPFASANSWHAKKTKLYKILPQELFQFWKILQIREKQPTNIYHIYSKSPVAGNLLHQI